MLSNYKNELNKMSEINIPSELLFLNIIHYQCNENINFVWLGSVDYNKAWSYQKKIHKLVIENKIKDTILFLEHPHVYTFGKNADKNFLLPSRDKTVDVVQSDRGGQITYHGPGQLVVYPIIDLKKYVKSISWYIKTIEYVIIDLLKEYSIDSNRNKGLTGVWVEDEKIAAIGVRLKKWVTMHGYALNVKPNLNFYQGLIPCGIFEHGVTSIFELLNIKLKMFEIVKKNIIQFERKLK